MIEVLGFSLAWVVVYIVWLLGYILFLFPVILILFLTKKLFVVAEKYNFDIADLLGHLLAIFAIIMFIVLTILYIGYFGEIEKKSYPFNVAYIVENNSEEISDEGSFVSK